MKSATYREGAGHMRHECWSDGAEAMREAAAQEAEKRAIRHRESMGGSSIDALHGAMADAYEGFAIRIRTLVIDHKAREASETRTVLIGKEPVRQLVSNCYQEGDWVHVPTYCMVPFWEAVCQLDGHVPGDWGPPRDPASDHEERRCGRCRALLGSRSATIRALRPRG